MRAMLLEDRNDMQLHSLCVSSGYLGLRATAECFHNKLESTSLS